MIDFKTLLDKNGKLSGQKLAKISEEDRKALQGNFESIQEAVWNLQNERPKCLNCGALTNFQSKEYSRYCTTSCGSKHTAKRGSAHHLASPETKKKIEQTLLAKYGVTNIAHRAETQKKREATCLEKYGATSFLGSEVGKPKVAAGVISKYGVANVSQAKEVQDKKIETSRTRYGTDHPAQADEIKKRTSSKKKDTTIRRIVKNNTGKFEPLFNIEDYTGSTGKYTWNCLSCNTIFDSDLRLADKIRCRTCDPILKGVSRIEIEIGDFVESLGFEISRNNRTIIGPKELDIVVENKKVAFEVTGLYWHSEGFKPQKTKLLDKTKAAELAGYRLISIFEDEWNFKRDIVKSRISNILGKQGQSVYARKCEIREVSGKEKSQFLANNHIQGKDASSLGLGLYFENELVSLATFRKTSFVKGGDGKNWELSRFCTMVGKTVVGAASKLISHFQKNYNKGFSLISYADRRWSDGGLYKTIGFEFAGSSDPSYWYTNDYKTRVHRSKLMKHRLVEMGGDPSKTERQLAEEFGYDKIYDCGTTKWILKP